MRNILILACWMLVLEGALAAHVKTQFSPGVDQEALGLVLAPSGELALLVNRNLPLRKRVGAFSVMNPPQTLSLEGLSGEFSQTLLKVEGQQEVALGRAVSSKEHSGFSIVSPGQKVRVFSTNGNGRRFDADEALVLKIAAEVGEIKRLLPVKNGWVVIAEKGGAERASFVDRGSEKIIPLKIQVADNFDRFSNIDDAVQNGDKVLLVATYAPVEGAASSQVWVFEFSHPESGASIRQFQLPLVDIAVAKSKLITGDDSRVAVAVVSWGASVASTRYSLFDLGAKSRRVYSTDIKREESGLIDAALACGDGYVLARRMKGERGGSAEVKYSIVTGQGELSVLGQIPALSGGVIANLQLKSLAGKIYSIVNFSKTEDARRPDGWYSWGGYRLDAYSQKELCAGDAFRPAK